MNDGLKGLSDREIVHKMRQVPTMLKRSHKRFLKKLRKLNVKLDAEGEVDYSETTGDHVVRALQQKEQLVKTVLMQADLEFEYPHKLEKLLY